MPASETQQLRRIVRSLLSIFGPKAPAKRRRRRRKRRLPRIGRRWSWNRQIPDRQEQEAIGRIVAWRQQRWSWYRIARELLLTGVKTASGRDWSTARVRWAYHAYRDRFLNQH
jgi:hypothetical protein